MIGTLIALENGAPVFTPAQMGEALGLDPESLRAELRAGRVHGVVERGEGEDRGRTRATLRWRSLEVVLVLDAEGRVVAFERRGDWRKAGFAPSPPGR